MIVTDEDKKRLAPWILMIMMMFIIAGFSYLWNKERNERIRLQNDKSAAAVIEGIEQPGQSEIKGREDLNASIDKQIADGNTRLAALYNVEKDIKDRRVKNVSKKDDIIGLSRELAAMGFSNTVISGNYSTVKTFTNYSTKAGRGTKVK